MAATPWTPPWPRRSPSASPGRSPAASAGAGSWSTAALDFRETAPAAIQPDTFAGDGLHRIFTGYTTAGVPGTVAGMQAALDRYGAIGLAEAIAPAERLARKGFEVPGYLSEEMGNNVARLKLFPASAKQFLVNGEEPYPEGAILIQPELAGTLALIASGGPDAFYEGEISERIVEGMQSASDVSGDEGRMTQEDLASYEPVWREPLVGEYRGREILAVPPPTPAAGSKPRSARAPEEGCQRPAGLL